MINAKQVARAESKKRKLEALLRLSNTVKAGLSERMDESSHTCVAEVSFCHTSRASFVLSAWLLIGRLDRQTTKCV